MKTSAILTGLVIGLAFLPSGAGATGNAGAKIMLHALTQRDVKAMATVPRSAVVEGGCNRAANTPADCSGYDAGVSNAPLYPTVRYMYLLVTNASQVEGIAGLQCGIDYESEMQDGVGFDNFGWVNCASLEFITPPLAWGAPGSGIIITWDRINKCQRAGNTAVGAVAVAGYFYCAAYTPECVRVTPRPVDGAAKVANCFAAEEIVHDDADPALTHLGAVCFGQPGGINPCGRELPVPVAPTTWGRLKTTIGGS